MRSPAVACRGGRGRTGTAIAALAILAGIEPDNAVDWVRQHYNAHSVGTPWQHRWVKRLPRL
jgi:protein-tyrosine phosphatase